MNGIRSVVHDMPPRGQNQNDPLLDKILGGRDAKGKFLPKGVVQAVQNLHDVTAKYRKMSESTAKQVHKLTKQVLKSQQATIKQAKAMNMANKSTIDALKRNNALIQSKVRLQAKTVALTNRLRNQRRELDKSARAGRGFSLSLRGIATGTAAILAIRKATELADQKISASILGGVDIGKRIQSILPKGLSQGAALQSINKVLQEQIGLRFGASDEQLKAVAQITKQTKNIGIDNASQLIGQFVGSLEQPDVGKFLGAVNQDGVRAALTEFANLQNVGVASQLRNALDLVKSAEQGKVDPVTEAALKLKGTMDQLNAEFEKLATTGAKALNVALAGFNKVPEGLKLPALGAAAVLGAGGGSLLASTLAGVGGAVGLGVTGRALKSGKRLISRVPGALQSGAGVVGRGLQGAKGLAVRGLGLAGRGLALGSGIGLTGAAGIAGAATGVGLPAIIGAGLIRRESERAARDFQSVLDSFGGTSGLDALARGTSTSTKRDQLKKERRKLESILSGITPGGTTGSLLLGQVPSGEFTKEQKNQIEKLRESIRSIQDQTRILDAAKMRQDSNTKAVVDATKSVQGLSISAKNSGDRLADLQQQAVRQQALQLPRELQASITALARQQKSFAEQTPFGVLSAFSEIQAVNASLQKETEVLQEILALQDQTTTTGKIQALQLRTQIVGLRTESRSNLRSLQQAFIDNALSQASQAGRFEKIIINQNKNLGIGLRKNLIGLPSFIKNRIAGSIDPNVQPNMPIRAFDVLKLAQPQPQQPRRKQIRVPSQQPDMSTLLRSTAKAFNKAANVISRQDVIDEMGIEPGNSLRTIHIDPGH